ncbi:CCR4-NOT transcription complex subunit 9 [Euphorbia peplus]|nr:CCR4-NOT transcription complex subunit 9 [Euphorbia peplus]
MECHPFAAKIPLYLHPLLKTSNIEKSHEYLRLTSLGVIGSLIKNDDEQALQFILKTETFPCFLHCMEIGTELTRTVATYILNRVLSHDDGLKACEGFRLCLPAKLSDSCVIDAIRDDPEITGPYLQLYRNVADGFISTTQRNGLTTRSASSLPRLIRS